MATVDAGGGGFEFSLDPVDRFPLPDLGGSEAVLDAATTQTLVCTGPQSSVADIGDATMTLQLDLNSSYEGLSLSAPTSEQSGSKDDPQSLGWTMRIGFEEN
ncbi:hypothetical protein VPH35_053361 [Triticum aestivum]